MCDTRQGLHLGGCGTVQLNLPVQYRVRNQCGSRSRLESRTVEGDRPVDVKRWLWSVFPSNTEPLKFRVNLAGPPVKPKYSLMTDSGQVP